MIIQRHPQFDKHFAKRILPNQKLVVKFQERIGLFIQNARNPVLSDHKLSGSKHYLRSFSITGDFRVIYQPVNENVVLFVDIGTHNQVYK